MANKVVEFPSRYEPVAMAKPQQKPNGTKEAAQWLIRSLIGLGILAALVFVTVKGLFWIGRLIIHIT